MRFIPLRSGTEHRIPYSQLDPFLYPFNPEHALFTFLESKISIFGSPAPRETSKTMNTFDLIEELENDLTAIRNRLNTLKLRVWEEKDQLAAAQERNWMLEQLADPNNDGHPYSDTLRT